MKVGRSSGLTNGTVLAYALEYNDEIGICFLTDFLVFVDDGLWISAAIQEQRAASATAIGSTVGDSSPAEAVTAKEKLLDEKQESLGLQIQHIPLAVKPREADWKLLLLDTDLNLEDGPNAAGPSIEHEFIPSCSKRSPLDGIVGSTTRREMLPQVRRFNELSAIVFSHGCSLRSIYS
ncbi:hypothetical protein MLD38_035306 [Melastoma candidum]|uniref:Uncharacterized protein n=1 Tax=Melastoma candidum TaxID=119954 RepID=A0ACB9MCJ8_9MYRT|nr:hypothetical protein MLD38_035306 [Melastoma candidum]